MHRASFLERSARQGDEEICFGTLELDRENNHDTSGHVWQTLRLRLCCPGCSLTIPDFFVPVIPPSDDGGL